MYTQKSGETPPRSPPALACAKSIETLGRLEIHNAHNDTCVQQPTTSIETCPGSEVQANIFSLDFNFDDHKIALLKCKCIHV